MYTSHCCGMIAVKREVAARLRGIAGFPWSECQEVRLLAKPKNLTASHCTNICLQKVETRVLRMLFEAVAEKSAIFVERGRTHTEECTVTACRTWKYFKSAKRRRLFLWQVK